MIKVVSWTRRRPLASLVIRQPTRGNVAWARRVLEAALEYVMWR